MSPPRQYAPHRLEEPNIVADPHRFVMWDRQRKSLRQISDSLEQPVLPILLFKDVLLSVWQKPDSVPHMPHRHLHTPGTALYGREPQHV